MTMKSPSSNLMSDPKLMTAEHPLWTHFCARLGGPKGVAWHVDEGGQHRWKCDGDHAAAFEILNAMAGIDVDRSLEWMSEHDGHCDCEILLNIDAVLGGGV